MQNHLSVLETAMAQHRQGRLAGAKLGYRQILRSQPKHPEALYLLGILHLEDGEASAGEKLLVKAVQIAPHRPEIHYSLGKSRVLQGRWPEAVTAFSNSLALNPDSVETRVEMLKALAAADRPDDAEALLHASLSLFPKRAEFYLVAAEIRRQQGRDEEAAAILRDGRERCPEAFAIHYNLGRIERTLGHVAEAADCYRRCLELEPGFVPAIHNLGKCLKDLWDVGQGLEHYRRAAALGSRSAFSNVLMTLHYRDDTDWQELAALHRQFGDTAPAPLPSARQQRGGQQKLRVGLVSGDLGRHPVGYMLDRIYPHLDRREFSLHCYVTRHLDDDMATAFRQNSDGWIEVGDLDDRAVADRIRRDRIDVLIDLAGHTGGNRLGVFALQPARVQMTGFGYFNTVGLPQIGYLLADGFHVPDTADSWYVERVVRLPAGRFCYAPPPHAPDVAPAPLGRTGHATFGCFNNLAKVNGATLDLWAQVLHAVPGSRLVIKAAALDDPTVRTRLSQELSRCGVLDRVTLAGRSPHAEYLAAYADIDVCLDPFPFGGGLTTLEALWMGVPVVSLVGPAFVSRQGLSILSHVGLPQLAVANQDEYVRAAADLVSDPVTLAAMRQTLRAMMGDSPLCDGPAHARGLEGAIRDAVKCDRA